jgi:peroxiredoxin
MPSRRHVIAAAAGLALGAVAAGAVIAFTGDDPDVDGEFVLDEPGIYSESVTTANSTGDALPDVELVDAEGRPVAISSFAGTPTVINVWYSTCAPCARELRDFAEVSEEYAGRVQFVGVDPVDDTATMTAFAAERGVEYPLLLDSEGEFVTAVSIAAFPTTLFVSADGQVLRQTNAIEADDLRAAIDELLV